jgi:signal recognition particle GTPase
MGDIPGLMEALKTTTGGTKANEAGSRMLTGGFTLRDLYEQFANVLKVETSSLVRHNCLHRLLGF